MTEIFLRKVGDFDVKVSPYGTFYAYEQGADKPLYDARTLEELKEILKRHRSNKRHFKPIDVIDISREKVGRITSRVADDDTLIYFTWKDKPDERARRTSTRLMGYEWVQGEREHASEFAKATPENLATLAKIEEVQKQIEGLDRETKRLRGTYGDLVTWEDIEGKGAM